MKQSYRGMYFMYIYVKRTTEYGEISRQKFSPHLKNFYSKEIIILIGITLFMPVKHGDIRVTLCFLILFSSIAFAKSSKYR
jgi:hypothetical protein